MTHNSAPNHDPNHDEILGFTPIRRPPKGSIVTQAFILCTDCGKPISPVGGPRREALCVACTGQLLASTEAPMQTDQGAVAVQDDTEPESMATLAAENASLRALLLDADAELLHLGACNEDTCDDPDCRRVRARIRNEFVFRLVPNERPAHEVDEDQGGRSTTALASAQPCAEGSASGDATKVIPQLRKMLHLPAQSPDDEHDLLAALQYLLTETGVLRSHLRDARIELQRYHNSELPGGWTEELNQQIQARHRADESAEEMRRANEKLHAAAIQRDAELAALRDQINQTGKAAS